MSKIPLHASKTKSSVKSDYSKSKMCKNKSASTQTSSEMICKVHNEQITELLSEVALTMSQKSTLEKEIHELRNNANEKEQKFNTQEKKLEQEIFSLKSDNYEKELELSKMKITHLEEQRNLLKQISELKSHLQKAKKENESLNEKLQSEIEVLEKKIATNDAQIQAEVKKNSILLSKIAKYKNKIKLQSAVLKHIVEEQKKQEEELKQSKKYPDQSSQVHKGRYEPNVEEMILTELFFKPRPIPSDLSSLFFRRQS